jgi:hypothetical protein
MTKIVAIMPTRNSAWCLGLSARALLMWVDELHILMHACTDGTPGIVADLESEYPHRVFSLRIESGVWQEMAHRQLLLQSARANGATHIVIIDDDEVVTGNLLPVIRTWVLGCHPCAILQLPWLQLRNSIDQVITTGMWGFQPVSTAFVDHGTLGWRAQAGYDHHHRHPMGQAFLPSSPLAPGNRTGGLMHLQMVSDQRLRWKHLHYKLIERYRWPDRMSIEALNAMYDRTVNECDAATTAETPANWWHAYDHLLEYLDVGAVPWQASAAQLLMATYPRLLDGLTTYGLDL